MFTKNTESNSVLKSIEFWLILTISPIICFLLVRHPDDVINMAFQKENNNNCIIFVLSYITQKRNIIKMIKFKIILNDKICIELYYYALFIRFS